MNTEFNSSRLRIARNTLGMSLDSLVEQLGNAVTKQAISKYERGLMTPKPQLVQKIADALGVKEAYFYGKGIDIDIPMLRSTSRDRLTDEEEHRLADKVKLITHKQNQGLPAARNTGLAVASGEYIFHCDSDDYMELDMLESLYNKAKGCDADVVWCDFFLSFEINERYMKQPSYSTPTDALKAMLSGAMKYNVWNKLCRRSLYVENGITFPDGKSMGEDLTMVMVFLHAKSCTYVNKPLYNYVQNPNQMTAVYNEEKLESLRYNCTRTSPSQSQTPQNN